MKKIFIAFFSLILLINVFGEINDDPKKKYGEIGRSQIFIIGVNEYLVVNEIFPLYSKEFFLSKNLQSSKEKLFSNASIGSVREKNDFILYSIDIKDNKSIKKSGFELFYKYDNKNLYVSKDKKEWHQLKLKLIKKQDHPFDHPDCDYIFIIYVECPYFKGKYIFEYRSEEMDM